jgi:glycosyltransferase involved in cell wall biosynthesis
MPAPASAPDDPARRGLKVVIVLPPGSRFDALKPTSIEAVVRSLARHSQDRNDLTVLCDEGADRGDDLATVAIPQERSPRRRALALLPEIARLRPDVVEMHQHMPSAAALTRRLRGTPTLLYRHNFLPPVKDPLTELRHRWRAGLFGGHVFCSEASRQEFADRYPRLADRAVAISNAIDVSDWRAPARGRAPIVAFAGRATPEKGLAPLCASLVEVLTARPDWRAALILRDASVNAAWTEAQLVQLAPFGDRVSVRRDTPHETVRDLFQEAAIVVIPSLWREPFGLVAIEAHAAGAAVVTSGTGGLSEASGDHACIVPPGDDFAARIAQTVVDLIDHPDAREALALDGQAFVARTHDAHDRSRQLDAVRRRLRDAPAYDRMPETSGHLS